MAPAVLVAPRGPDQEEALLIETTIAEKLRKLEEKLAHELMAEEERLELRERILKLKAKTEKTKAGRAWLRWWLWGRWCSIAKTPRPSG